jgi:hypothetical protein
LLLWSELGAVGKATISFNKVMPWSHLLIRSCDENNTLPLADLVGEEEADRGVQLCNMNLLWWFLSINLHK